MQNELELIEICAELGSIADSNNQYTLALSLKIKQPVESLTIAELLSLHRDCLKKFNQQK